MPSEFLRRKLRVNHKVWNGTRKSFVIFFRSHVNGQPVPYVVGLVGLHAHGWDPLIPTDAGVYEGLQGVPGFCYI